MRNRICWRWGILVVLVAAAAVRAADDRPNIVIILSDDQGWGDVSVHGNQNLATPNIDSLATDGALFDRFYVCPVCSPTRAELLTGRYHPRSRVVSTSAGGERMDLDEKTIAQTFKAAGYATGAFGKWHNGMQYPYHPNARGFDEFYGFCSGHWGHYFDPVLEHNGKLTRGKGYINDCLTDKALQFINKNKGNPFFCYVPFNTPHSPLQVPDRWYEKFTGKELKMRARDGQRENVEKTRAALAMCENIDFNVGRILKKLDDLKLDDNTIVIYFSDNGPNGARWNGGMRGVKGSTYEGGVRVPCVMRWPAKIKAGTKIKQLAAAIDLLPTLADVAGVEIVSDKPLDGISIKPLLLGDDDKWPDRMIFSHWNRRVSVRTLRYRLDHTGKLYDMQADPGQRKDIAAAEKDITAQLTTAVSEWKTEMAIPLPRDNRPFSVGYRAFPITHLPARDGKAEGNIKRSNRFPNCSFFTNWTSTDDRITWPVDVATAGSYEATIYYTCPAADVGSTFELSFAGNRIEGKVNEAHDPPLVGAAEDRIPRMESYVKDFKPLKVGVMQLKKGQGNLTLRATQIPGKQVMDVRYVVLTLQE